MANKTLFLVALVALVGCAGTITSMAGLTPEKIVRKSDAQLLQQYRAVRESPFRGRDIDQRHLAIMFAEILRRGIVRPGKWADMAARGRFNIGMTDAEIVASIGRPARINRSVYASGIHVQWVYPSGLYVYLEGRSCMNHSPMHPYWRNDGPYKPGGCAIRSWQD